MKLADKRYLKFETIIALCSFFSCACDGIRLANVKRQQL